MVQKYDPDQIVDLFQRYGEVSKVVAETGAHKSTVNRILGRGLGARRRPIDTDRALKMIAEGKTDREVADALSTPDHKVARDTIGKFRRRRNIPTNYSKDHRVGRYRKYDRDEVRDMFLVRKMTIPQVARELGCEIEDVYYLRQKAGVSNPHPQSKLKPLSERLKDAEAMLDEGASFAEVERTVHISHKVLIENFPGRQWTREQAIEHALDVRYGEQRINKAWATAHNKRLTQPPLTN